MWTSNVSGVFSNTTEHGLAMLDSFFTFDDKHRRSEEGDFFGVSSSTLKKPLSFTSVELSFFKPLESEIAYASSDVSIPSGGSFNEKSVTSLSLLELPFPT